MSTYIVESGKVVNNLTIGAGYFTVDKLDVFGTVNDTVVSSGGSLIIESKGRTNRATVNSYGFLSVSNGGFASSRTIYNGSMHVCSGSVPAGRHRAAWCSKAAACRSTAAAARKASMSAAADGWTITGSPRASMSIPAAG